MKTIAAQLRITASTTLICMLLTACSQTMTVSVNSQPVYDPQGRLLGSEVIDADLQGCINLAMQQQNAELPAELTVLSCPNGDIRSLDNIGQLVSLRFLDLGNNSIRNITPLEDLPVLGGLNLVNNNITDLGPLFNMPGLTSVNLQGNNNIRCQQLRNLRTQLGDNLTAPDSCRE